MEKETNLARMRKAAGLSLSQLSLKAGIPQNNLSRWEGRSRDINQAAAAKLKKLAEALDVTMEDLMEEDNNGNEI